RAYAAGGVRSEGASWPTNFGGVDTDSPDSLYRHGGCTLAAQAAGSCLQDFVQRFNPLAQRSPFRTALRRQYGLSVSGGSNRAEYRLAGDFSGSDGPFASSVASPDPNYYRAVNSRGRATVRPWSNLEVSGSLAHISSDAAHRGKLSGGTQRLAPAHPDTRGHRQLYAILADSVHHDTRRATPS